MRPLKKTKRIAPADAGLERAVRCIKYYEEWHDIKRNYALRTPENTEPKP